jgi:hypothetical protein
MRIESYTLADTPFNYLISFPFPEDERQVLEDSIRSIDLKTPTEVLQSLETEMAKRLTSKGYYSSKGNPDACRLWFPDFKNEIDFYNPSKKIAVEVEKSEVKRVIHDMLKLVNGSMTFMPKVKYGVLVMPNIYVRKSGKKSPFFSTVKRELPFYFQKIIPDNCNLQDVLIIVYNMESV